MPLWSIYLKELKLAYDTFILTSLGALFTIAELQNGS